MPDVLDKFVENIKTICGPNLKSLVLYGSKASGEDTKKYSDYNLLMVLENASLKDLRPLSKIMKSWIKQGNKAPLVFTMERLKNSTDVFPIEFLDMKNSRRVLYGDDPFQEIKIQDVHLRHECEFELQGKLLKLRQGYMASQGKPDVKNLLISSLSTFLIIFRHIVRLIGEAPPQKRLDALNILASKTGLNPSPFITIFNMKNADKEALKQDPETLMAEYLKEIEKIVSFVDSLE